MYRICVIAAIKYPKFNKLEIPAFSEVTNKTYREQFRISY
jgi:hypothetical protein